MDDTAMLLAEVLQRLSQVKESDPDYVEATKALKYVQEAMNVLLQCFDG